MNLRVVIVALVVPLAAFSVPAGAGAQPATHSPLDPVRLAADFAPGAPTLPAVRPFEDPAAEVPGQSESAAAPAAPAASAAPAAPADSLAPAVPPFAPPASIAADDQPSIVAPVAGALVGGAAGLYGGGLLGLVLFGGDEINSSDFEDAAAFFGGAAVGEVLLMAAGAHFANGSRGSYGAALGGSALGFAGLLALGTLGPAGAIAGVVLQTALTVAGERRSARREAAERAAGALPASAASVTLP